jgi:acetyl esterase/lipase
MLLKPLLGAVAALTLLAGAFAPLHAQALTGETTVLPLYDGRVPGGLGSEEEDLPTLTVYLPPAGTATGAAVVIFPGGGYGHLATEKEGAVPARWLNGLGVAAFVVRYRLGPKYHHPAMLWDAQRAIRAVRARAGEWGVDPGRIGVLGFSAGGHLASTAATHFDAGAPGATDAVERVGSRPDFAILVYPVITMQESHTHRRSRENLLGTDPSPELLRLLSNETQVTAETPPTFLVTTTDDASVPVENSLLFFQALRSAGVPAELHVFRTGRHGFGLAPDDPVLAAWLQLCEAWLRSGGWLGDAPR